MKLVIDRATWLRNEGCEDSFLLREEDGKKCCLGFYCLALGLKEEDILGRTDPADLNAKHQQLIPKWLLESKDECSATCHSLMKINDNEPICDNSPFSPTQQEKLISETFAKHGVKVTFI